MSTAEGAALAAMTVGVAWVAHRLGRSASWRARLRRPLRHRAVPWVAVVLAAAGAGVLALLPWSPELPRRYADYQPDVPPYGTTASLPGAALAGLLIGGSLALAAVWWWLRYPGPPGRRGWSLPRHVVPVVGGLLLLAGLLGDWIAGRMEPESFGWFLYAPLADEAFDPGVGGQARTAHVLALTLGVLGLGVLTAVAAFREGRKET